MAYPSDTITRYVVTSSINHGAEFDGSKSKLFEKVFIGQSEFLPEEE
jgi:hypothetical protein